MKFPNSDTSGITSYLGGLSILTILDSLGLLMRASSATVMVLVDVLMAASNSRSLLVLVLYMIFRFVLSVVEACITTCLTYLLCSKEGSLFVLLLIGNFGVYTDPYMRSVLDPCPRMPGVNTIPRTLLSTSAVSMLCTCPGTS